jgi:uncharacterized protein
MKRVWHNQFAERFTWMLYAFFQPRRLERELAVSGFRQRFMIMLRMVIPILLVTYPVAVLGQILLVPFHLLSHPDIASILLFSAFGIAFGIVLGVLLGIALGIAGGIALGIAGGIALSIAASIAVGVMLGIAGGIVLGVLLGIALGIALGVLLGIVSGIAFGIVLGIVSGIMGVIIFNPTVGTTVVIAVGVLLDVAGSIALGIAFAMCYLLGLFRLPFYLVSGPSALKAYLKSRGDPAHVFYYLHRCSLYWDEIVYLPLPYLKQTLLIASAQDAEKALEEIAFIAAERPRQLRAARGAALEMAIGYIEQCKTIQEIAEVAHYLDTIFPQETKLLNPQWSAPITRIRDASRDAQRFSSPIGRVARMEALDDMVKQLKSVHPNVAFRDARLNARLGKVIDIWLALARQEQEALKQVPVYIGRIDNPYNPGYPLKPEDPLFQGRYDLAQVLESVLMKGDRRPTLLLTSERRMGKSSALLQLPRLLGSRFLPVFYDLQSPGIFASTTTFLGTLADGIYKEMQARNLPVEKLVYRTFRDYSTQVASQTILSQTSSESLAPTIRHDSPYAAYSNIDKWLKGVESVLEREDRTLLLMLDEFEKLEEAEQKGAFELSLLLDWLRNIIQYHPRIALLFSGLHTFEDMQEQKGMGWSGYFVNVQTLHVGFLQDDEARRLVTNPTPKFSGEDIYEDDVVEYILDQTRGHPFLVQAVCYALIENLNVKKKERANPKDVDGAIERVFNNFNNYFSDLWNRTDEQQRVCLIALQKAGTASIERLQEQSGLKEHTLWHTLHALLKRDLVRMEDDRYSISTPIFGAWVERNSRYMEQ